MTKQQIETGQSSAGAHRLEALMWCPRAFAFSEIAGYERLLEPRYRAMGTAIHAALAAHYSGDHWQSAFVDPPQSWAYVVEEARPAVAAYFRRYPREDFEVVAVEKELAITVGGFLFTRRFDLLVNEGGVLRGYDHKKTGRITQRLRGMDTDPTLFTQDIVGALCAESLFGLEWGGLYANLIEVGSKGKYDFLRKRLWFPERVMKEALADIEFWSRQADHWVKSGLSPWEYPKTLHCQRPWGWCDYLDLCTHGAKSLGAFTTKAREAA